MQAADVSGRFALTRTGPAVELLLFSSVHLFSVKHFLRMVPAFDGLNLFLQSQKEYYLNYRKAFYGDTTDVFERRKNALAKVDRVAATTVTTVCPTPFSSMSNAAAATMVSALHRRQEPAGRFCFSSLPVYCV